jgi:hypothetical protein
LQGIGSEIPKTFHDLKQIPKQVKKSFYSKITTIVIELVYCGLQFLGIRTLPLFFVFSEKYISFRIHDFQNINSWIYVGFFDSLFLFYNGVSSSLYYFLFNLKFS